MALPFMKEALQGRSFIHEEKKRERRVVKMHTEDVIQS